MEASAVKQSSVSHVNSFTAALISFRQLPPTSGFLLAAAALRPGNAHGSSAAAAGTNTTPWLSPVHRQVLEQRLPWVDPFWQPSKLVADSLGCLAASVLAPSYNNSAQSVTLSCSLNPEMVRRVNAGQATLQVSESFVATGTEGLQRNMPAA